jgi:hypothetical protein
VSRAGAAALALGFMIIGCSGGRDVRPLRMAVTESGGDFTFSLEEPVRSVTCVIRDYRRSPSDPAAATPIWTAQCRADCLTAIRYGDRALESTLPARALGPSSPGACYECTLTGDHGRGLTRFRVNDRSGFEPCQPRVGDL